MRVAVTAYDPLGRPHPLRCPFAGGDRDDLATDLDLAVLRADVQHRRPADLAAVVYGYIPRKLAEDLKQAIAGYYAATTTLQSARPRMWAARI